MRLDWEAAYLDGRSAARRRATVRIGRTGLEITVADTGQQLRWPYRDLRQTQGTYAGEQVRLERGGELTEALLVSDVAFLAAIRRTAPETGFHDPARRRFRVGLTLVALVATVGVALTLYFVGLPAFAQVAAARVPVAWEAKLGEAIAGQLAPPSVRCEDPERQARIQAIADALLRPVQPARYTFTITVVNHGMVNAVAAPGGSIIVFRGLLDRTDSAEELAGVLAHEFQHVLHRHATRAIFQQASAGILMAALVGDVSGVVAFGLESARMLADLRMSRHAEAEADRDGMRLLQQAGIDGAGMVTFFEKLSTLQGSADPGLARYLMTHPAPQERLDGLRALAAQGPRPAGRLMADYDWSDLKTMCGAGPPPRSPRR